MENTYEIWSEGYRITGNSSGATYHGTEKASSFAEACDKFFIEDEYYRSSTLTYWACRLFDNEEDARKNYG